MRGPQNGIQILGDLHSRHPEHYETRFNLAHAYIYLGEAITTRVNELGGDIGEAILPFDQGKQHLQALMAKPDTPTLAKAQYLTALYKRSIAACQLDRERKGAIEDLIVTEQLASDLMKHESRNNFVEERLLVALQTHADCEMRESNLERAFEIASRLVTRRQEKFEASPSNPLVIARLIESQGLIARISMKMSRKSLACDYYEQGRLMMERLHSVSRHRPSNQVTITFNAIQAELAHCTSQ